MPYDYYNDNRYRSTTSLLPFFLSHTASTPKLTTRTTNVRIAKVVEFTTVEAPFGPVTKKRWQSEVETSSTETYE